MEQALAKELRDAGFPQRETFNQMEARIFEGKTIYTPANTLTLEELIEAIPPFVFQLSRDGNGTWRANGKEGSTPVEAVARLLLALNRTEAAKS